VVLLAWFGSGSDEGAGQVDVIAHALGFIVGALLGLLAARPRVRPLLQRIPQWLTGLLALAQIAIAWRLALSR
jgi:membrane associated rhomboid family serine protease